MGLAIMINGVDFSSLNLGIIHRLKRVEKISITGSSTINNNENKSTYSISYTPLDTRQTGVSWSIVEGSSYASINSTTGEVSVLYGADGNNVVIAAISLFNQSVTATKQITVTYKNDEEQAWLNRLSELKCVFYSPLNQGDLSDHISGSVGEPYNGSSYSLPSDNLTWSDTNNAYLLHAKNVGQVSLRYPMTNLQSRITEGDYLTEVIKLKKHNNDDLIYLMGVGTPEPNNYNVGYSLNNLYGKTTTIQIIIL
jgi:hypothetical protein